MSIVGLDQHFGISMILLRRDKYDANDVLPGLTGWAQINGRDALEIEDKARYDGYYTQNIGLKMDLKCFIGTIVAVLKRWRCRGWYRTVKSKFR